MWGKKCIHRPKLFPEWFIQSCLSTHANSPVNNAVCMSKEMRKGYKSCMYTVTRSVKCNDGH